MRNYVKPLLVGSVLAATSLAAVPALAEVSANVDLTSNYVWRGISQSNSRPAMQGGFDYSHSSGFYAGVWGSNVDWTANDNTGPNQNGASVELDTYLGVTNTLSNGLGYDVGAISYNYPGSKPDATFVEYYLGGSYKMFSAKYSYSPNFAHGGNSAYYVEAALNFDLPQKLSLGLHAGRSDGDYWKTSNGGSGAYTANEVSLSRDFSGYGVELAYTDTSGGTKVKHGANRNDGQFMVTLSKSL